MALQLDHPVRWVEDRGEHLLTAAHTRDHHYKVTAYADRQGRILGVDAEIVVDAGAYGLWPQGPYQEAAMAARNLPGPYTIANYRARHYTVATNKAPLGPYRGVGRPGACFAIERTIDEVARAVGRDPVEVRAENMVRPEQMPFTTVGGMRFDNGDYPESVRLCAELLDLPASARASSRASPTGDSSASALPPLPSRPRMGRPNSSPGVRRSFLASRAAPREFCPTAAWC